ncbi:sigma-E factor negative regulatory protein [Caldimonas caldifontis]|uniref:sigma-E factor negative regulatory protein n=1 Tax=Caldimonas caldifontis TaxID=1452508 RepID=UPI001FE8B53A|nr:sigma-E factor negative regulatory protein [Caldimonas caldifontis]
MSAERKNSRDDDAASRERLSAILDGEATPSQFDEWLASQLDEPEERSRACEAWHVYHLIGDVMRSDDLARSSRSDDFVAGVRERLRAEPVVVAPAPVSPRAGAARRPWRTPLATAAGVVAVAGALIVLRLGDAGLEGAAPAATLAQQPAPEATLAAVPPSPATELRVVNGDQTLIRDARLDDYLAAHKQFGGGSALGSAPSMFLRNAAHEGPGR